MDSHLQLDGHLSAGPAGRAGDALPDLAAGETAELSRPNDRLRPATSGQSRLLAIPTSDGAYRGNKRLQLLAKGLAMKRFAEKALSFRKAFA